MSILRLTPERYAALQKRAKAKPSAEARYKLTLAEASAGDRKALNNLASTADDYLKEARLKSGSGRPFPASGVTSKPNKYGARKTGSYASGKEANRAAELKLMEAAGEIVKGSLREQVPFILIPAQYDSNRKLIERQTVYVADFVYETADGKVVEDVKSIATKTDAYVIKRKLLLMVHGIRLQEI